MSEVGAPEGQRLDQWLWCARFAKSRTLAQALILRGKVRVNRTKVDKTSHWLKLGDVVTLSLGPKVRVAEVRGFGTTRRSAPEAARLFQELTPALDRTTSSNKAGSDVPLETKPSAYREAGSGRPTKQDRRAIDRLKGRFTA